MMFNQFTQRSKQAVKNGSYIAVQLNSPVVGTEHLLAGILGDIQGVAYKILTILNFDEKVFFAKLQETKNPAALVESPEFSPRCKQVFELARA
ncbi:MAG: Clp protease N-terminal domain-containing protein, partial [Clostridiales bacterium]